jgi:CheY-like chemotaxis protein
MSKRILWLDNDTAYINVYIKLLRNQPDPYEVTVAATLSEAEDYLKETTYDLIILDVMIPTTNEEEERAYPPDQTDHGLKMGLSFYKNHQKELVDAKTKVLILTARIDEAIKQGFVNVGLPPECIVEKAEIGEVSDFLGKVEEVINRQGELLINNP